MDEQIQKGDVVSMKSGSCKMCVTQVTEHPQGLYAHVSWQHYDTKEVMATIIAVVALKKEV